MGKPLSKRERQVSELACEGKTNPEIADALDIAVDTVAKHLSSIFDKTGVRTRNALASAERQQLKGTVAVFEQLVDLAAEGVKAATWHRLSERTPRSGIALRVMVRTPKSSTLHEIPALFVDGNLCVLVKGTLCGVAGIVLAWTEVMQPMFPIPVRTGPGRLMASGITKEYVELVMHRCRGSKSAAAREMKIPRSTLYRILEGMKIA